MDETKLQLNPNFEHFDNLNLYSSPMKFFKLFLTQDIIEHITFQSNLYATQLSYQNNSTAINKIDKSEIESVIGIILMMGIHKLPN